MYFLLAIKFVVITGFVIWLGHMSTMLYVDLQEQQKSTSKAVKLWLKAFVTTILVIGIIIN